MPLTTYQACHSGRWKFTEAAGHSVPRRHPVLQHLLFDRLRPGAGLLVGGEGHGERVSRVMTTHCNSWRQIRTISLLNVILVVITS